MTDCAFRAGDMCGGRSTRSIREPIGCCNEMVEGEAILNMMSLPQGVDH